MIYLTQLLWIHEGREAELDAFEDVALGLLSKHGGELLLRLRPGPAARIGGSEEPPHEVHVLRFASDAALAGFVADEERRRVLHLKDAAVRRSVLIQGALV